MYAVLVNLIRNQIKNQIRNLIKNLIKNYIGVIRMNKILQKTVPLAMSIIMMSSATAFGAEAKTVKNVSAIPAQTAAETPVAPVPEVPVAPVAPVQTEPVVPVVTPETVTTTPEVTSGDVSKKPVPRELESKPQPSLFTEPQKVEPVITEPEPAPVVSAPQFEFDIASYTTKYKGAESLNRNFNVRLASDSINGVILQPGQVFSFNDIILAKSDNGKKYKEADVYMNGKLSTGIGGGFCQVSSTLYQAALYSGMDITKRQNHSLRVGYIAAGRDATASWGTIDFKFKNPLDVPVKIESVMQNGVLKIRFLSNEDPKIGKIVVKVAQKDDVYTLTRTRENGKVDHTSRSKYKD